MLSRISQFKQSLSDEFEQAVSPQRPLTDPVSVIERNAQVLRTETPDVKDIMIESDPEDAKSDERPTGAAAPENETPKQDNASPEPSKPAETSESDASRAQTASPDASAKPGTSQTKQMAAKNKRSGAKGGAKSESNGKKGTAKPKPLDDSNGDAKSAVDSSKEPAGGPKEEQKSTNENSNETPSTNSNEQSSENKAENSNENANEAKRHTPEGTNPTTSGASAPTAAEPNAEGRPAAEPTEPQARLSVESQRPSSTEPTLAPDSIKDDPVLAAKLAKFEKYEQKYPGLLKAYKTEKKKNDLVRIYEKVLSEHTPCTSIAEPQELVNYLKGLSSRSELQQTEIGNLSKEVATLKAELASEKKSVTDLKQELDRTKQRSEQQIAEARAQAQAQASAQLKADETAKLKETVAALEQQLAESQAAGSVAARTQTTLRTQLDELGLRLAETQTELEVVRDELADTERRAQERLQELSSVRQALRSRDKDRRRSVDEATGQIAVLTSEKEQLEAEVELLGRRIVRETEQLHVQLRSVRSQLRESEAHAAELQQELDQQLSRQESTVPSRAPSIKSATEPSETDSRAELAQAQAEAAASGAVKANELLKQVNADNSLRIEKLLKAQRALTADLEQLRSENQQLRRRSSISSADMQPFDSEKQKAYLRNVLLGFIEHRDQRKMLLPVLATLLGFQDGEEEKLLSNLK